MGLGMRAEAMWPLLASKWTWGRVRVEVRVGVRARAWVLVTGWG